MTSKGILSLLVAAVLALCGCNNTGQSNPAQGTGNSASSGEPGGELAAQARPPVPDVPLPAGFTLNEKESRSIVSAGLRYVDHVYEGRADKYATKRFYIRMMPASQWMLVSDEITNGEMRLAFEKEGHSERCAITIGDNGFLHLLSPTKIRAIVQPVGRVETPGAGSK